METDQDILDRQTEEQLALMASEWEKAVQIWNDLVRERVEERRKIELALDITVAALERRRSRSLIGSRYGDWGDRQMEMARHRAIENATGFEE